MRYGETLSSAPPGQPVELQPRPPTPLEQEVWDRFVRGHEGKTADTVSGLLDVVRLAEAMDRFYDSYNLPFKIMDYARQDRISSIIERYNRISRIILRCEQGQYYVSIRDGSITVSAPQGMKESEYRGDMIPQPEGEDLGAIIIAVAVVVGIVAAIGIIDHALERNAHVEMLETAQKMREADAKIAAQDLAAAQLPPAAYKNYKQLKKIEATNIKRANKAIEAQGGEEGFFDSLFGKVKTGIGLAAVILIGIVAFKAAGGTSGIAESIKKSRKKKRQSKTRAEA